MDRRALTHTLALTHWLTEMHQGQALLKLGQPISHPTTGDWAAEFNRRLRALAAWLDVKPDVSCAAGLDQTASALWFAHALADRLVLLLGNDVLEWRADAQVNLLSGFLAGCVDPTFKSPDASIDFSPQFFKPYQPGGVISAAPGDSFSHPNRTAATTFTFQALLRQLGEKIESTGWRFVVKNNQVIPMGELIAPAGYLPALLWVAEEEAFNNGRLPLWEVQWLASFDTPDPLWGREAHLACLPTFAIPDDVLELDTDERNKVCARQASRWAVRILAALRSIQGSDLRAPIALDAWMTQWAAGTKRRLPLLEMVTVDHPLHDILGYEVDKIQAPWIPSLVVFTQPPLETSNERGLGAKLAQWKGRPIRLACWPADAVWLALHAEFPWAKDTIDRLAQQARFGQRLGQVHFHLPPLLLVGQAGCGKTRLAQRLSELCQVPGITLSAAGVVGGQALLGTDRHWANAEPSPVLRVMHQHHVANPIIVVDEIDKAGEGGDYGSLQNALLPLLEYESARQFMDPCLAVPCDLSAVSWVLTANDLGAIKGPLRSRIEVIEMDRPKMDHLEAIVVGVRQDMARHWRVDLTRVPAWAATDSAWVRQQMGPGSLFTAREAKRMIERRLMREDAGHSLTVVR